MTVPTEASALPMPVGATISTATVDTTSRPEIQLPETTRWVRDSSPETPTKSEGKPAEPVTVSCVRDLAWKEVSASSENPAKSAYLPPDSSEVLGRTFVPEGSEKEASRTIQVSLNQMVVSSQMPVFEKDKGTPAGGRMVTGTPAAWVDPTMSYTAFQSEIAGPLAPKAVRRPVADMGPLVLEATLSIPQPATPIEPSVKPTEPPTPKVPQPPAASAPRVDRFAELVATEATILRQFRPGVLTAVVRPDPGSELRIELRLHRGQVEARASLERGDAEAYQAAWSGLQAHLRSQGIELQPLGSFSATSSKKDELPSGPNPDAGSQDGRPSHRPPPHEGVPRMVAFGNLPDVLQPAASVPASIPAVGGTRHLLESWA